MRMETLESPGVIGAAMFPAGVPPSLARPPTRQIGSPRIVQIGSLRDTKLPRQKQPTQNKGPHRATHCSQGHPGSDM